MGPRNAGIVAARIIALYLGIEAVTTIISYLLLARGFEGSSYFWGFVGPRLVIAWVLWILADRVGAAVAGGTTDAAATPHPLADLLTVGFVIVGVVFVMQAIPQLLQIAISGTPSIDDFSPLTFFPGGGYGSRGGLVVGALVRLGLGVVLMLRARPLAVALHGRDRNEPPAA